MKDMVRRLRRGVINAYRREILGDHPLREAQRWKLAGGTALLYDFPLGPQDVVLDIGGHVGGFAAAIHARHGCTVHIFEPVLEFCNHCKVRFRDVSQVQSHCYGLAAVDGRFAISNANEASSLHVGNLDGGEIVEVREAGGAIAKLGIDRIGLIKMNIEGAEYEVLAALIEAGIVARSRFLLLQFHTVGDWVPARETLRARLRETHDELWCYDFVWEAWQARA
jgi:FkbM family methyltransferase